MSQNQIPAAFLPEGGQDSNTFSRDSFPAPDPGQELVSDQRNSHSHDHPHSLEDGHSHPEGHSHDHPHGLVDGHSHPEGHSHDHLHGPENSHSHDHPDGHSQDHQGTQALPHSHGHSHTHTHENTKAVLNRLSRAIGHLEHVKKMVEDGRDCSEVLIQIAAVRAAINNVGKVILQDHLRHCIVEAVEQDDQQAISDLCDAVDKFVK